MVGAAASGRSLLFFPEGGFTRIPGIAAFHMGAFVAACEAGVPVVPVAIRGTRSILRAGSWFPRRGAISVVVGEAIRPAVGDPWPSAVKLRDKIRRRILRHCGEPDLAAAPPGASRAGPAVTAPDGN
jgi:1-acyl-sn-glycerol-3-phosphate acyltransferase